MINKLLKYYHTIKYLSVTQLFWLIIKVSGLKNIINRFANSKRIENQAFTYDLLISNLQYINHSIYNTYNEFTFLNKTKVFNKTDWNFVDYGMLWLYNLNYFDYLLHNSIKKDEGIRLINEFIDANSGYGYDPYPLSLRIVNWIKFIVKNKISDQKILKSLFLQVQILKRNIEFHLQANHLFENGVALLWSAYFFNDKKLYKKANKIICKQLNKQILKDGAHYELSPMYHQIILNRLLDIIDLAENNRCFDNTGNLELYRSKAAKMCCWLKYITYNSGSIPLVNDSTNNIALTSNELFIYANKLDIPFKLIRSIESGYRMIKFDNYEVLVDIGSIQSNAQPGHTHSDIFNFELIVKNQPVIVDTGISTYEKNERRQIERSITSHNTVQIGNIEPMEVWGGFRVAKRAKISIIEDSDKKLSATHNGYEKLGVVHKREFGFNKKEIEIKDRLLGSTGYKASAIFHFSNEIEPKINNASIETNQVIITFDNSISLSMDDYKQAIGFNKLIAAKKVTVIFKNELSTKIAIK